MIIQFNTDKTISGEKRRESYFTELIIKELQHYSDHITRLEVHISDENGNKEGPEDIRCLIEARIEGKQPIAVKNQASTDEKAVSGAVDKLKSALKKIMDTMKNHR
ncbi:MAG: HPF/RaiA family ribosome-associated protein [Bacteroidia bacterium]